MAYKMTKQGSLDNEITYEFFCDTAADMELIEAQYRTLGSIAIVLEGESGGLEIYITNSSREWTALNITSGSDDDSSGVGFNVEIVNSLPQEDISEGTIYFLAKNGSQGDSYDEYMYINNNWEKIGNTSIDLSNYATKSEIAGFYIKPNGGIPAADLADTYLTSHQDISGLAPKASPVFTDSISMGRKDDTTIGNVSVAVGVDTTASGYSSHAEGYNTTASEAFAHVEGLGATASGVASHAEGNYTTASGSSAHAEGQNTTASGPYSHAEGLYTVASGYYAHAEGHYTVARRDFSHVQGLYNVEDNQAPWPEWAAGTEYEVGDIVKITTVSNDTTTVEKYVCTQANTDTTFTSSHWVKNNAGVYAVIVGNGSATDARSNAYALDWDGNGYFSGDLYVGCDANSQNGTKVLTSNNPEFTGSISMGRKANTTVGDMSVAIGFNTTASGYASHAEGLNTTASSTFSHAEGAGTTASQHASHAEGNDTTASAMSAHAEGYDTVASSTGAHAEGHATVASGVSAHAEGLETNATGWFSHAEGQYTTAFGQAAHAEGSYTIAERSYSHVSGKYNVVDNFVEWPEWISGHSYETDDMVKVTTVTDGVTKVKGYICKTPNTDAEFTQEHWTQKSEGIYAFIIGNGIDAEHRSNAFAVDWSGRGYFGSDLFVHCPSNSTEGQRVATTNYVDNAIALTTGSFIPATPTTDGSYILQATVTNGTPTYSWVSLSSLSGVTF